MKVIVLGAGVIGVTQAWYLAQAGHEVTVIDRQPGSGLETSFANGGQISVSHAEPWANPGAPAKVLKWLWREDAPLLFRLRLDPAQWSWGLIRDSGRALVDATAEAPLQQAVRAAIESDGDAKVADLHIWQVGGKAWAGAVCVVADRPLAADVYRQRLASVTALKHLTIEVNGCTGEAAGAIHGAH